MSIFISTAGSEFSKAAIDACRKMVFDPEKTSFSIISAVEYPLMPADPFVGVSANYYDRVEQAGYALARRILDESADRLRALFQGMSLELTTEAIDGSPVRVIVEEAEKWQADLIVVGSHGYGFWCRAMLGSFSSSILHHADCSVLVVRAKRNVIEAA